MTTRRRISRQESSDHVAARVAAAQELLTQKVTELRSGEDWKRYLAFQARLHHYSSEQRDSHLLPARSCICDRTGP
jgi:hypothetical protein